MGVQLSSTLRQLCDEIGWSYAVFWRRGSHRNLAWGDAAVRSPGDGLGAEGGVGSLVYEMMAPQVHVVGDGIVGQAGLTGRHQWIIWGGHGSLPMGLTEMNHHFLAGIQTIAVIPVLPHGVVQLGSTQMVMENIEFIDHVRSLFEQLVCVSRTLVTDAAQKLLSQHNNQNASVGVSSSFSDSQDFGPYRSRFSSLDDDKNPIRLLEAPNSRYAGQHCSSLTSLYRKSKMPVNSSEVSSTTLNNDIVPLTEFSSSTFHRVVDPIIHPISESVGAQVFSKPGARSIEMLCGSSSASRYQSQIPSGLSSSGRTSFEEQFSSIPISQGPANNHMANSKTPKQLHGCIFSTSSMDPETVLPLAQKESPNKANDFGRCNSFGGSTAGTFKSQCPISPNMNAPQTLEPMNHSARCSIPTRDSQPRCSTSIQKSQSSPSEARLIKDENLFQTVNLKATQLEEDHPCDGSVLDIPEVGWLSSSNPIEESQRTVSTVTAENQASAPSQNVMGIDTSAYLQFLSKKTSTNPVRSTSGSDLFDLLGLGSQPRAFHSSLGDIITHGNYANAHDLSADVSTCITQLDTGPMCDGSNEEIYCNGLFTESPPDQLLDAVVGQMKVATKDDNVSCRTSLTNASSILASSATRVWEGSSEKIHAECVDLSPATVKPDAACSSPVMSLCSMEKSAGYSKKDPDYKSQLSLWVNSCQMSDDNIPDSHGKQIDEVGKLNRKRSRSGENPRPRPKDRQMIQDRVKELREIVPNGAKCSIDALLEKTIKHMLFLQSVTKHADKLKEVGEPKIVNNEGGLLLKDNFEGGATWAFEVGTQSMICPIIVEDLNPPRQMLVEMLCEEQGLFLEIADLIRGLGLTILKGVMEARNDKVWARFAVEANRDVARMEIFLSLVRLLEPNAGSRMVPHGVENHNAPHNMYQPSSSVPATGLSDHLR